ncbi:Hypothetical protein Minf_1341 [Methylacidiphilum infernorum V4]|uniref:Uncharacterized protein n=1 Tax=Methylacidiphilum infernorum (isolate V4) TaxID=481448 RepID=B3DVP2_METI4|nr:Hypothetical protein Minf_1341 [Methylacidiphilum infernorum V4]
MPPAEVVYPSKARELNIKQNVKQEDKTVFISKLIFLIKSRVKLNVKNSLVLQKK